MPLQFLKNFTALRIFPDLHIHPFLFSYSWQLLVFLLFPWCFAFSQMSYSWNHALCSFLRFLHVFSWLIPHFFLALNIPLSGCTTVHSSIHLLKDISVAFKFWKLNELNTYKCPYAGFVWMCFQLNLSKYRVRLLDHMVKVCFVF